MKNREPNLQDYYVTTTVANLFYLVLELREKFLPCFLQQILRKWTNLCTVLQQNVTYSPKDFPATDGPVNWSGIEQNCGTRIITASGYL